MSSISTVRAVAAGVSLGAAVAFMVLALAGAGTSPGRGPRPGSPGPKGDGAAPRALEGGCREAGGHVTPAATAAARAPGRAEGVPASQAPGETREPAPFAQARSATPAPTLARIRGGLASADPDTRLASVREARDLQSRELEADVALLLAKERSPFVRRVATQVLALGDAAAHERDLRAVRQDPDVVVQINASFGLARAGDEVEQGLLVAFCEGSRVSPQLLPIVAAALEDPALRSPAVLSRFQQIVDDPGVPEDVRAHAAAVLRSKRG